MTQPHKWDIVFLITGKPLPAMLDMALFAKTSGMRVLMIILERGASDLIVDRALVNYDVVTVDVPYKSVSLRRLTSFAGTYRRIKRVVVNGLEPDGILVTSAYDLLVFGRLMSLGRRYRIRHQVRDLHALQLSGSPVSRALMAIEGFLLRRVERVVVSSAEFASAYYSRIYDGRVVLLENLPAWRTWAGFKRMPRNDGVFRIGFIGILRYPESLTQLIRAVQRVAAEGLRVEVKFAGGGDAARISSEIRDSGLFVFLGPYEYTKDITELYADVDLIYAVYDSNDLNCQIAMPNKFYESILSRTPILVAKNTFVERQVKHLGIGTSVLSGDVDTLAGLLRDAIAGQGWYAAARECLDLCDPEPYYVAYEQALRSSVLP